MITKLELIEYLKHTPENTNYNILYSSLYNGSNKEIVDEFIEVLSRGNLSLAALQPYLAKLYEDDKTISPDPLPPFSSGSGSVPKPLTYDYMPEGYPSKSVSFNVEWDGNTEGLTSVYNFYKVSDLVVDPSVFASGATLTYADGSTDFMSIDDASKKYRITIEPGKVIFGEGQVMIFTETPAPPYEAFEIGVYFQSGEIYDVRKVTGGEVITPMAEEFLPNIPADKLPSGGGSADAVLYTPQTLTDAQKKQARQNIDVESYFVVNGTMTSNFKPKLDKTFSQIREAISDGKIPIVAMSGAYFQLSQNTDELITFLLSVADGNSSGFQTIDVYPTAVPQIHFYSMLRTDIYGALPQINMASDPTEAMQIATKQYVDAQAGDFIVTATLSDDTNCTLDKTFDQIQEAIHGGKRVLARLSTGLSAYMPLVLYNSEALFFGATTITYDSIEVYTLTVGKNVAKFVDKSAVTYNSNSAMPQVSMAAAPTEDMEIATKKYVDEHAGGVTTLHINVTAVNQETREATFTADKTPLEMQQASINGPVWCVVTFAAGIMGEEALSTGVPPAWYGGAPAFGGLVAHIHSDAGNNDINYAIRAAAGSDSWVFDINQFGE